MKTTIAQQKSAFLKLNEKSFFLVSLFSKVTTLFA